MRIEPPVSEEEIRATSLDVLAHADHPLGPGIGVPAMLTELHGCQVSEVPASASAGMFRLDTLVRLGGAKQSRFSIMMR
jgi:hypothetical protein